MIIGVIEDILKVMNEELGELEHPAFHEKLALAKTDRLALNRFIGEYMPFIKKCAGSVFFKGEALRENLSEAMLGFIRSVQTYKTENGAFIPYAQTVICIRRLPHSCYKPRPPHPP